MSRLASELSPAPAMPVAGPPPAPAGQPAPYAPGDRSAAICPDCKCRVTTTLVVMDYEQAPGVVVPDVLLATCDQCGAVASIPGQETGKISRHVKAGLATPGQPADAPATPPCNDCGPANTPPAGMSAGTSTPPADDIAGVQLLARVLLVVGLIGGLCLAVSIMGEFAR